MSHECVRCNTKYGDDSRELIKGCPCGNKAFIYKKEKKEVLSNYDQNTDGLHTRMTSEGVYEIDINGALNNCFQEGVYEIDLDVLINNSK